MAQGLFCDMRISAHAYAVSATAWRSYAYFRACFGPGVSMVWVWFWVGVVSWFDRAGTILDWVVLLSLLHHYHVVIPRLVLAGSGLTTLSHRCPRASRLYDSTSMRHPCACFKAAVLGTFS
jgi:hypothetical protein